MNKINIIKPGSPIPRPLPAEGCIFLVDKPLGWSSFAALAKVRYRLSKWAAVKMIKIGHTGTLDPLASGLLVFCVGKYTKRIHEFQAELKEYTGTIALGATTPGYDLEMEADAFFPTEHITNEAIETARLSFIGKIKQVPPIFSAVKKDGKRLYELARDGEETEIEAKTIEIFDFDLKKHKDSESDIKIPLHFPGKKMNLTRHIDAENVLKYDFKVRCGKGTYIRSLAFDFGHALGSGAYLSMLRRTASGEFRVEDAWTVEALTNALSLED